MADDNDMPHPEQFQDPHDIADGPSANTVPDYTANLDTPATALDKAAVAVKMAAYSAAVKRGANGRRPSQRFFITVEPVCTKWGQVDLKAQPPWTVVPGMPVPAQFIIAQESHANGLLHYHCLMVFKAGEGQKPGDVIDLLVSSYRNAGLFFGYWNVQVLKSFKSAVKYCRKEDKNPLTNITEVTSELKNALQEIQDGRSVGSLLMATISPGVHMHFRTLLNAANCFVNKAYVLPLRERILSARDADPYPPNVFTKVQIGILKSIAYYVSQPNLQQRLSNWWFITGPGTGKTSLIDAINSSGLVKIWSSTVRGEFAMTGFDEYVDIAVYDEFDGSQSLGASLLKMVTGSEKCSMNVKHGTVLKTRSVMNLFMSNKLDGLFTDTSDNEAFMARFEGDKVIDRLWDLRGNMMKINAGEQIRLDPMRVIASLCMLLDRVPHPPTPPPEAAVGTAEEWDDVIE